VLLALFERIPNEDAIARAPTAGWMMLGLAVCLAVILIIHREGFRRLWMQAEDPRTMGVFRIAFAICATSNINGLWEIFEYLFTDEGIFLTDVARQVFARDQFDGFGNGLDGDPYGFFDFDAIVAWLKGPKYSLLFFWDSPTAWWIHWAVWQAAMIALIVGFKTKYTKWIAWFLFMSIIERNSIYWEGTENVYRTFFFYLCLSRCGQAYSVDNWLRCRKLKKQGRLSTRDGPGGGAGWAPDDDHPEGLEPIYRRIPAWPRLLVILQCMAMYCYTGVVKNGSVWWKGDAFYYALNLDHFYRVPPQQLSSWFGTNLFRINSHIVHAWESLFPLPVLALFIRFGLREKLPALSKNARRLHAAAWLAFGFGCLALVEYLWPVHFAPPRGGYVAFFGIWKVKWTLQVVQWVTGVAWVLGIALIARGWYRLRYRPYKITIRKKQYTLDLDWFLRWFFGRRVWVFLGCAFHLHLMVLMNIGWFQPGSLAGFITFLNGGEIALFGAVLFRRWRKHPQPIPVADPKLPGYHVDAVRLPVGAMIIAACMAVGGVVLQVKDILAYGWTLVGIATFLGGALFQAARSTPKSETVEVVDPLPKDSDERLSLRQVTSPWAYGPLGRFLATCLVIYHVVGVALWLMPDKDSFNKWRGPSHTAFRWWLTTTQTTQGWRMFAPNPPRGNRFLKVLVTDSKGETWDMKTDVYAEEQRPIPWIWYTRQRKINRRISGAEGGHGSWYQKWHARWFCRRWALEHDGEIPSRVQLIKITNGIPTPEWARDHGPYDPVERIEKLGKEEVIYTAHCRTEVDAQVPRELLERHGIDAGEDHKVRRWNMLRNREKRWQEKKERERKKREEEAKKD
jgi:hypothetical protein